MSRYSNLDKQDLETASRIFHMLLLAKACADDETLIQDVFLKLVKICPESIEIITSLSSKDMLDSIRATQFNEEGN